MLLRFAPVLLLLSACGGSVHTDRPETQQRCRVNHGANDVTFIEDPGFGYGFSLPPPAAWTVDCIDEENRVLRGSNEQIDAAVTVSVDATQSEIEDGAYLRTFVREAREQLRSRGMEVTAPRYETVEGAPIGLLEIRTREGGEASVHVAAFSTMRRSTGGFLRFMVVLPTEGRFGHRDDDPIVRRATLVALSFGSLE